MSLRSILNDEQPQQVPQVLSRRSPPPSSMAVDSTPAENPTRTPTEHPPPVDNAVAASDYSTHIGFPNGASRTLPHPEDVTAIQLPPMDDTPVAVPGDQFKLPQESWAPFGSRDAAKRRRRQKLADEMEERSQQAKRQPKRIKRAPSRFGESNYESDVEESFGLTEEDIRLNSTDLEDCEEVWVAELSDYIIETRKRESTVERQFEIVSTAANADVAAKLSRSYIQRLNRIPTLPPTPTSPPTRVLRDRAHRPPGFAEEDAGWLPGPSHGNAKPNGHHRPGHHLNEEPAAQNHHSNHPPLSRDSNGQPREQDDSFRSQYYPSDDFPRPEEPREYYRNINEVQFNEYVPPDVAPSDVGSTIFIEEGGVPQKRGRSNGKGKEKAKGKGKDKDKGKGKAKSSVSEMDSGSETERPLAHILSHEADDEQSAKRRKLDNGAFVVLAASGADIEHSPLQEPVTLPQRDDTPESVSSKVSKQKPTRNTKKPEISVPQAEPFQLPPPVPLSSFTAEPTHTLSRPTSPAHTGFLSLIHELHEHVPPPRKAKKADHATLVKRIKTLEESQKKVWTNIARRDIAKAYKFHVVGYQARQSQTDRVAKLASMQARKPYVRTTKTNKDIQTRARKLMREMQVFWKKNEREERDVRKKEQKEANDRAKIEEEAREAARQARKLEFLISQTELYSHFVGSKLKTSEIEGDDGSGSSIPVGASLEDMDRSTLRAIDFNEDDTTNLHQHARANAQEAVAMAKQRAQEFDVQAALDRKTAEALQLAKGQAHIRDSTPEDTEQNSNGPGLVDLDSEELNFQNPTSLTGPLTIAQPKMLMAELKEYQLKGLNWLATLYEQGINGILADEMGLGKTVQAISLIAYLAETHDIWGPFLVVTPTSTLHNWQQEITRFVPSIKSLPYWGQPKDRASLRKFWNKKEISYNQDAPFHVLITSYNMITQDQQYFQRVKWQYMILDEAQNIKNSASVRWKTLLGLQCRNRLLLTGTPIQNSMQELWALLHFIMPSLFDSHDEFNEWFSKDIESAAENKGAGIGERQLRRLHMILKPFMLRRIKKHVQNELGDKIEIDIFVDLSARQRGLYKTLLSNVSVTDLLTRASKLGDSDAGRTLMNLVMQFRKVCNHPELFERADVVAPFSFCCFGRPLPPAREGDSVFLQYSSHNPIQYTIPRLLYEDGGLLYVPRETSSNPQQSASVLKMLNIWSSEWIHDSLYERSGNPTFSFLRLADVSPGEAVFAHSSPLVHRIIAEAQHSLNSQQEAELAWVSEPFRIAKRAGSPLHLSAISRLLRIEEVEDIPTPSEIGLSAWNSSYLSRADLKCYIPRAAAPPISMYCDDRNFLEQQERLTEAPLESLVFFGLPPRLRDTEHACRVYSNKLFGLPTNGLLGNSPPDQVPPTAMTVPQAVKLIYDSAKLARLDTLLQELRAGGHRVLIYFQMTRMMDLMEEYLVYRQYKYLRLDGSSKLEERRDMVMDWQTRPDIFIFILSTRAGGVGINLTAADTVIFYDHDWNPSNDAQAMDRVHRVGQTRQVTVYRLITKGTVDERIVQLAKVKKDVQDIVVGNKNLEDIAKTNDIAQLLLNDEQLAELPSVTGDNGNAPMLAGNEAWNDEGQDFFGHTSAAASTSLETPGEDDTSAYGGTRGKGRRGGKGGGTVRGRKSAAGKKRKGASTGYAA